LENLNIELDDLRIPVYLDQQMVFDLLAILDNGLSKVCTINTSVTEKNTDGFKKSGSLSLSNPLLLFRIIGSFNAELNKNKELAAQNNNSTEKVHTSSSLFSNLRHMLKKKGYVHTIKTQSDIRDLKCGDFVEFRSDNLNINPMIDYFSRINEAIKLASLFTEESDQTIKQNNQNQNTQKDRTIEQNDQNQNTQKDINSFQIIDELLDDLMKSNTTEIIGKVLDDHQVSVDLSCKSNSFINNDKYIVANGEFCIFGKVTNALISKRYKIDLLRKTSFRSFDEKFIEGLINSLDENKVPELNTPKVITKIEAPAIQVLPIAIFI